MAVFTPVSDVEARNFLSAYDLGDLIALTPIAEGVENTNYALQAGAGRFVLTLFEGRTDAAALPFCLGLTDWLAQAGLPTAQPVRDRSGAWLGVLNGRSAAVVEWLSGAWPRDPSPVQAQAAGAMLARMHLSAADYPGRRANPVGPVAWRALAQRIATRVRGQGLDHDRAMLDRVEAALIELGDPFTDDLPVGAVHADYFPDNVLFQGDAVSGVIDFYFACTGPLAYDLAIALSAWGFDGAGRPSPDILRAFRSGYDSIRPLSAAEAAALPRLGRAAALRFTLTRLHDRVFHDPSNLVTPKDPAAFLARLDYWR
ncbi:MAG: homoserine kinase [Caulobacterales bacterium]|nr:homoserine kinase [Caulobacterales bacterium]